MSTDSEIPLLDHDLADDELSWISGIRKDFAAARAAFAGRESAFNPKEALREVLGRTEHRLATPMDLSGDGPWRHGRNSHGRLAACVFLKHVELHRHAKSRTDQFPIYVVGEADAFSIDDHSRPILTKVTGDGHFHNVPGAPHAFLPKIGKKSPEDWEIAFIAITPRNLKDDTQMVSEETKLAYQRVVGLAAPMGI